ncbi:MAG: DUF1385 domain-containing protein [Agathobacter rectalis]
MKYSGIGGQAVMEGVMMQNKDTYAVAVRKPDHEIDVKVSKRKNSKTLDAIRKFPILRGVVSFVDSLYLGMSTLMYSASFFEDEDDEGTLASKKKEEELTAEEKKKRAAKEKKQENAMLGGTVVLSIVIALALFFALPYFLSGFFKKVISSQMLIAFIEGVIRLAIFLGYIAIISLTPDIKRTFMYHGSEHKCINCIEHGLPLTVENVRKSSKHHKRCGTSFLLIVMLISILFFMFIRVDSKPLQLLLRLVLIPVIAGVSYEFIRLAGRYDNPVVNMLSVPGLLMQRMTTKEPDDEMIEVGIASVEAVFDWKKWQEENNVCAH